MGMSVIVGLGLAMCLADPPAEAPTASVSLGVGWIAAQAHAPAPQPVVAATTPQTAPQAQLVEADPSNAPLAVVPRASIRPPSVFDAVRHTRGARAAAISVAVAVQGAMIVYGILSARERNRQAADLRSAGGPKFNPFPR
ncbi:MAG: hypothetical protein JKY37_06515 [Nannocystaceae bacterium]|nr:hypothetical protein [Nannocystaceae bacterium]